MRNTYILNPSDFTFIAFHDSRNELGRSGQLLLATGKPGTASANMKLLVKHEYATDVPNEFVAGYIAGHLGFINPKVYLFRPCNRFQYAVGIEYMDRLEPCNLTELTDAQEVDLIHQVSLNALVCQEDIMQMNLWNGHVVSYDFANCFLLEGRNFPTSLSFMQNLLCNFADHIMFAPDVAMRMMRKTNGAERISRLYYDGLLPILELDEDYLLDILLDIFPENIAGYYDACVHEIKEQVKAELSEKGYDR